MRPVRAASRLTILSTLANGVLLLPITQRLTDHSPSWVRIPARIAGMSKAVCSAPVTRPAAMPASVARKSAR